MSKQNNIGFFRFIAAFAVLFGHTYNLCVGRHGHVDPISSVVGAYMPFGLGLAGFGVVVFFILSGYLVAASFDRSPDLLTYVESRCLRIFPGLIGAVLFCTYGVGWLVTSLPTSEYLTHPGTISYLWNNMTLLEVRFRLPGVFEENPWVGAVNGSLWTLPIELLMYGYVVVVGLLGWLQRRAVFNLAALILVLAYLASPDNFVLLKNAKHYYLGLSFLVGTFFYVNRDVVLLQKRTAVFAVGLLLLSWETRWYDFLSVISIAYIVLAFGFDHKFRLPRLDRYGDLSYGLYLYAFPLQQLAIFYLGHESPWLITLWSLVGALSLAYLSWHFIERPAMKYKGFLSQGARGLILRFNA